MSLSQETDVNLQNNSVRKRNSVKKHKEKEHSSNSKSNDRSNNLLNFGVKYKI